MSKTFIAFGDIHLPYQDPTALEVAMRAIEYIKPDCAVCMGDLLDCYQFSAHPPTRGVVETEYSDDLAQGNQLFDRVQASSGRLVMVEGNHENRIDRSAAASKEMRGAYSMLSPRLNLSRGRKAFTYIPYAEDDGKYAHYKINNRIHAVHGWSFAMNAARKHLTMSQGKSILYGDTHRADSVTVPDVWSTHGLVHAMSTGCLCQRIPGYRPSRVVEWVHAFVLGYLGREGDSLYRIDITGDKCTLPDGTEITAK